MKFGLEKKRASGECAYTNLDHQIRPPSESEQLCHSHPHKQRKNDALENLNQGGARPWAPGIAEHRASGILTTGCLLTVRSAPRMTRRTQSQPAFPLIIDGHEPNITNQRKVLISIFSSPH